MGALKCMKYLPKKVLKELYYKTVIPAVAYCITVWGNSSTSLFQNIEEIHPRAARVTYNLPSQTSVEDSLMHALWQSISYIYKRRLLLISICYETAHHSTQFCRIKGCGGAGCTPPPIIFERLKLPQQNIYRRKGNISESPNH